MSSFVPQSKSISLILKENPGKTYTARELAVQLIQRDPERYAEKRANTRLTSEKDLIDQVTAEVGSNKLVAQKHEPRIVWRDRPWPRVYWYDLTDESLETAIAPEEDVPSESTVPDSSPRASLSEHDLYPLLAEYLKSEHGLHSLRIDEKKSSNRRGSGGNEWLHPDMVAMEPLDNDWHEVVRASVRSGNQRSMRLWSFEVKKDLTAGNVRRCFFQAVSNSTWANFGYLVATSLGSDSGQGATAVEAELRMLHGLHGIGVLLLTPENPSESDLILPARERQEVDWLSVNRVVQENRDFEYFVEQVSIYLETGRVIEGAWKSR